MLPISSGCMIRTPNNEELLDQFLTVKFERFDMDLSSTVLAGELEAPSNTENSQIPALDKEGSVVARICVADWESQPKSICDRSMAGKVI